MTSMRKKLAPAAALLLLLACSGCFGPQKVTRQLDDWVNQKYVENPWLVGNVVVSALVWTGLALASLVDGLLVNPIDFWTVSAQPFGSGSGTPFVHRNPTLPLRK